MNVTDILIDKLRQAQWNPNVMDESMMQKLKASIRKYGLVENLVVRPSERDTFEVLSGNQRLKVLQELGIDAAACVIVNLDDAHARLLAQGLNRIEGEDDLGLRAELVRKVLAELPETEVTAILPETTDTLKALASMGRESMAAHLQNWQQAQTARLKHLQFQLTPQQLEVVEEAISLVLPMAKENRGDSPNSRGTALYLLSKSYLERNDGR
ncbi:MAG: ParB N-terminal domain-containing protein [Chloroflexi bacterium]|nr:ParB N-terminal domain-containing protein [Chloroflexota bacterium]